MLPRTLGLTGRPEVRQSLLKEFIACVRSGFG